MTGIKWVVLVLVLTFLRPARGDAEVSCVFIESCILPCSFQSVGEAVIHWYQMTTKATLAHSYYHNQDQLGLQDQHFRGRTSLFKDQISRGNASLRLTGVEVQDQGRYKCYTSTITGNKELFINLKVDAPVDKVDIQQVENRITCSSEGIYPQPELTWSTSPPSNVSLENNPTVQQTEQLLYNITSSLIASVTDLVYSCTVSTRTNNRTATLFKLTPVDKVDIQRVENRITCSSEGIYPQPELTWSTSPPSNVSLENNPTVQQTEQLLYNITSSLIASVTDLVYSCTVSTRTNNRTATLFKLTFINGSDTETTIPCESLNPPLTGLVWRFNHSQIILNQTGANVPYTVSEEWRQQVKSVSESGSLTLKDFSSDQEGIYTCELSNAEETYVTNTLLRIEKSQGKGAGDGKN
ncbi:hypothetical protein EPR50_G00227170 [Perca flavescens]|uniref:Ig-like domain-containing protein n=1 Tax=Perca flavescens TaxID=8167 RepID=A0A484C1W2_PERFV|nr:hypothetical protein EPR50_G00227170 [Perca flavescens]